MLSTKRGSRDAGPFISYEEWVGTVGKRGYKPPKFRDGDKVGELTVLGFANIDKQWMYVCECSCGKVHSFERANVQSGRTTRCDVCAKLETKRKNYKKNWWKYGTHMPDYEHRTRLLNRLSAAIARCHNPRNSHFHHYGGRGIAVCEEWRNDRGKFLAYVQTVDGWDDATKQMDRTDNNKGYEPGNIRFVSCSKNAYNKRTVNEMQDTLDCYDILIYHLRHSLSRAEEQIRNLERQGAACSS